MSHPNPSHPAPATPLTLVVLAAGMGSRYGGLKQIDTFGPHAERILDYSLYDALRAGFTRVVFVLRRDIEAVFRDAFGTRFEAFLEVDYAFQEHDALPAPFTCPPQRTKPWGTAHAVWSAREKVSGPFAVINADDFYGPTGYVQLAAFLRDGPATGKSYALVAYALKRTLSGAGHVARGVCLVDEHDQLRTVTEVPRLHALQPGGPIEGLLQDGTSRLFAPDTPVSMNLWGFTPRLFTQLESHLRDFLSSARDNHKAECYLPSAVDALLKGGDATVRVLHSPDAWLGVTYPEDREHVAAGLRALDDRGAYPRPLWASA